mmetsp:Transcript_43795/g.110420  ORF Transcript_43795/g.110420 Transcript_43795/m.110420 type:complete len:238 (+) Transcript_43795:428-1141(+)
MLAAVRAYVACACVQCCVSVAVRAWLLHESVYAAGVPEDHSAHGRTGGRRARACAHRRLRETIFRVPALRGQPLLSSATASQSIRGLKVSLCNPMAASVGGDDQHDTDATWDWWYTTQRHTSSTHHCTHSSVPSSTAGMMVASKARMDDVLKNAWPFMASSTKASTMRSPPFHRTMKRGLQIPSNRNSRGSKSRRLIGGMVATRDRKNHTRKMYHVMMGADVDTMNSGIAKNGKLYT